MATNKVPSLYKQPDCIKLIFCYREEFITDLTISTDLVIDRYENLFFYRIMPPILMCAFQLKKEKGLISVGPPPPPPS